MCKLVDKNIEVMLHFLHYISYLLQIIFFLWSKNPDSRIYFTYCLLGQKRLWLGAVWASLLGFPQEEASFTFSWYLTVLRFPGSFPVWGDLSILYWGNRTEGWLQQNPLTLTMVLLGSRHACIWGWIGVGRWGSYFHLMVANMFKSHGLGN